MLELNAEERLVLSRLVIELLERWGASAEEQIKILALPDDTRTRMLRRYREDTPLPEDAAVMERVEFLMAIAEALRTTYPMNPKMGDRWMKLRVRKFRGRTPVAIMVEDGMSGLIKVRAHLDCTFAWDMSGSKA